METVFGEEVGHSGEDASAMQGNGEILCECLIGCSLSDCVSVKLKKKCEQTNQPLKCKCLCDLDRLT